MSASQFGRGPAACRSLRGSPGFVWPVFLAWSRSTGATFRCGLEILTTPLLLPSLPLPLSVLRARFLVFSFLCLWFFYPWNQDPSDESLVREVLRQFTSGSGGGRRKWASVHPLPWSLTPLQPGVPLGTYRSNSPPGAPSWSPCLLSVLELHQINIL